MIRLLLLLLASIPATAQDADAQELARIIDRLFRSDSSAGRMTMQVVNPNYSRTLEMNVWSLGMDYTLVRVLSPRKERGVSTLKRGTEMWNYLPKIEKTVRIPPSMMMGSWMGSDFTNDDLMRESSWSEDYAISMEPAGEEGIVTLVFVPKPDAAVTWQKVTTRVDLETRLPLDSTYFDEKGRAVRKMTFEDVGDLGGRTIPRRMTLTPLLEEGHQTVVIYEEMAFDIDLETTFFSKSELKKGL